MNRFIVCFPCLALNFLGTVFVYFVLYLSCELCEPLNERKDAAVCDFPPCCSTVHCSVSKAVAHKRVLWSTSKGRAFGSQRLPGCCDPRCSWGRDGKAGLVERSQAVSRGLTEEASIRCVPDSYFFFSQVMWDKRKWYCWAFMLRMQIFTFHVMGSSAYQGGGHGRDYLSLLKLDWFIWTVPNSTTFGIVLWIDNSRG